MTINNINKILQYLMYTSIIVSIIIIVLFENEIFLPGYIENSTKTEFAIQILMELITICLIPFSLRLFKFNFVKRALSSTLNKGLLKWGITRLLMICIPMIANTLLYYICSLNVAFGYMAIIDFICLIFINPTMKRCLVEIENAKD